MTKHTATCKTLNCENYNVPIEVKPWIMVICGGGCGNIIQEENPNHPDFPIYEEEETVEEMVERLVQERLNEILPQQIEQALQGTPKSALDKSGKIE